MDKRQPTNLSVLGFQRGELRDSKGRMEAMMCAVVMSGGSADKHHLITD